ncbi:non-ribosomal peptide synthetase [Chitinophaga qingshengii]|uniref:Amino acid adenylation domain-containing protein n=1 Tax=Chitinophaga qingshengii TaxID=1569794 RepID=A0ABR7TWN4_9BACT|nr:non-ribosomal peptide synthetase [Chitinophaga qingshengii]MBC9934894.1 amino acid adenylation domain-containing protein [Chitinophaga qingshengii]
MTIKDVYPLSPLQSGILYHSLREDVSNVYFLQFYCRMTGPVIPALVEEAFNEIFKRHEILRTVFNYDDLKKPVQLVLQERRVEFYQEDLRHLAPSFREEAVTSFRNRDYIRGFDLRKDVLLRVAMLQQSDHEFELFVSFHHILMDGWCLSILTYEFLEIYDSLLLKRPARLLPVTPYKHYIQWLDQQDQQRALDYWRQYLHGFEGFTPIGKQDHARGYTLEEEMLVLDEKATANIDRAAAQLEITVNALVQTAWGILLGCYNDVQDVVFGTVVSGRPADFKGVETMLGLFINSIPVRISFNDEASFGTVAKRAHTNSIDAINYHYCQLADLQALTPAGGRLIDHLLVFENYPVEEQIEGIILEQEQHEGDSLTISGVDIYERPNYDLSIAIIPGKHLHFIFKYNSFVHNRKWVQQLVNRFGAILQQVGENPHTLISAINMVTTEEQETLLAKGAGKTMSLPADETAVTLFEKKVAAAPEQAALLNGSLSITYRELNEKANILAHTLCDRYNVKKGDFVALVMERSEWAVIGLMGIWKAGAVYVPIDPAHPAQRIESILQQTGVRVLITDSNTMFQVMEYYSGTLLALDIELDTLPPHTHNPVPVCTQQDISYVIYTSGSTGTPNGVLITHEGQLNMFYSQAARFSPGEADNVLQFASLSFDASVWEISMALLSGATLVIAGKAQINDGDTFTNYLNLHRISIATLPPAYVNSVDLSVAHALRILITAGEEARPEDAERYSRQLVYFNAYGPSEYSVCITAYQEIPGHRKSVSVPVGTPFLNTQVYILDKHLRLTPDGVAGEICVSGKGMSPGYLHNPALTAERFVPDPYKPGEKLYRTGDYGRWTDDGNLEFLGRKDTQIKIRGYRVEIAEVTAALQKIKEIKDAFILANRDKTKGDVYLTGYYVAPAALDEASLREQLALLLPAYMIPAFLVWIAALPLNTNGKVDKAQLPAPMANAPEQAELLDAGEEVLAGIWTDVLGVSINSRKADFFHNGGHSLKVIQLVSRIGKAFSVRFDLKDVFNHTLLMDQMAFIRQMQLAGSESLAPLPEQPWYASSPAQQHLWALCRQEQGTAAYTIAQVVRLSGRLNKTALEKAFAYMVARHEALRTTITVVDNKPCLLIRPEGYYQSLVSFSDVDSQDAVPPFDPEAGPLFHFRVSKQEENEYVLSLTFDQMIADSHSTAIFARELLETYHAFSNGMEPAHEVLSIQYKEYAAWLNQQLEGSRLKEYRKSWLDTFKDRVPQVKWPQDFRWSDNRRTEAQSISSTLNNTISDALAQLCLQQDVSLFVAIRAAVQVLLYGYTGETDIVTGMLADGRSHQELKHVMGCFSNLLPLRVSCREEDVFPQLLEKTAESIALALRHQYYPLDLLQKDLGNTLLLNVMVVEQGQAVSPGNHELIFAFTSGDDGIILTLTYAGIFRPACITAMLDDLCVLLTSIAHDSDQTLMRLKSAVTQKMVVSGPAGDDQY